MNGLGRVMLLALMCVLMASPADDYDLDTLARDFWAWRATNQPFSGDDIPRLDRPAGWQADWSPAAFAARRQAIIEFEARWKKLDASAWPVPRQVDRRLMGSAIERVRWELEVVRAWRRNPLFYIDQTLAAVHSLLLQPPPFDADRSAEIIRRLESIPETLTHARANLDQTAGPFARLAIEELSDVRGRMAIVARECIEIISGNR